MMLWGVLGIASGCDGSPTDEESRVAPQEVTYGTDDRVEVYADSSEPLAEIARRSVLALIPSNRLSRQTDGTWAVISPTAQERHGLCPDEPYTSQPAAADCSAVLIADDLVLTAGHCAWCASKCRSYAFVFNYWYSAPHELAPIDESAVYQCDRLVFTETSMDGDAPIDLAIVKLDRPVVGFMPVLVASGEDVPPLGTEVVLVGTPEGVPIKLDRGGRVQSYIGEPPVGFKSNVDAFLGSSGSGVFSRQGQLIGVLSSGKADFESSEDCQVTRHLEDTSGGESIFAAEFAVNRLCVLGEAPERLCGETVEESDVMPSDTGELPNESGMPSIRESRDTGCSLAVSGQSGYGLFGLAFWCGLCLVTLRTRRLAANKPLSRE